MLLRNFNFFVSVEVEFLASVNRVLMVRGIHVLLYTYVNPVVLLFRLLSAVHGQYLMASSEIMLMG